MDDRAEIRTSGNLMKELETSAMEHGVGRDEVLNKQNNDIINAADAILHGDPSAVRGSKDIGEISKRLEDSRVLGSASLADTNADTEVGRRVMLARFNVPGQLDLSDIRCDGLDGDGSADPLQIHSHGPTMGFAGSAPNKDENYLLTVFHRDIKPITSLGPLETNASLVHNIERNNSGELENGSSGSGLNRACSLPATVFNAAIQFTKLVQPRNLRGGPLHATQTHWKT
ncbi:hypothetical protein Dimus_033867, partial [Dionaea muscipula]